MSDQSEPVGEEVLLHANKGGRPTKLVADKTTIDQIRGMASIFCTKDEVAQVLQVSRITIDRFFAANPEAKAAYEQGYGTGRMSLRRKQSKLADKHPVMAIFLGKNVLGQSDRHEHTGRDGGAIEVEVRDVSDEELDARLRAAIALPAPDPVDAEFE